MTTDPLRDRLRHYYPHLSNREIDEAHDNLMLFTRTVLAQMRAKNEDRQPPHNLPTEDR